MKDSPDASVIICVVRYLDYVERAIEGWLRQSHPRDRYEILVMWERSDPHLERRIQDLLGARGRLIEHPSQNERELFDAGARQARGDLLVFAEAHCVPEEDVLEKMSRFLAGGEYAGACTHTVGRYANWIGRAISDDFDAEAAIWMRPGDRRKVIIHAFAISRRAYLDVGGYAHAYGLFADGELAVRLERHGHRLGYVADARVLHYYETNLRGVIAQYRSYAEGECTYRLEVADDDRDRWFAESAEWRACREGVDRRRILRVLVRDFLVRSLWRRDESSIRATARAMRERLHAGVDGPASWLAFRLAWLRLHLWRFRPERRQRAFRDMCLRVVHWARLRFVARHAAEIRRRHDSESPPALALSSAAAISMDEIAERHLVGFSDREQYGGRAFRWACPNAAIRLALKPDRYRVELETGAIRDLAEAGLRVFFNRHALPSELVTVDEGRIVFTISPAQFATDPFQLLILTCDPLPRREGEARQLGVSLFSLSVTSEHLGSEGNLSRDTEAA